MIFNRIKARLKQSNQPVEINIFSNKNLKVFIIGFKKGMALKAYKTKFRSILFVLEGAVTAIAINAQGETNTHLNKFDDHDIPIDVLHSIEAQVYSLCLFVRVGKG